MRRNAFFILLSSIIILYSGCQKNNKSSVEVEIPSDSKVVRIAVQPSAAFIPIYVVRAYGWLEDEYKDKNVKIDWQDFEDGPIISKSLSLGKSDIGFLGDVPTVTSLNIMSDLEIVGIPASGPDAYAVLTLKDSPIHSAAELKNKRVATVFGSTGHKLIAKVLDQEKLDFSDILLINISVGAAGGILESGGVDAVVLWEPFVTRVMENCDARILLKGSYTDLRGTNTLIARTDFSKENPEIISSILSAFARAVKNLDNISEDVLKIISWQFRLTPEQIKIILKKYDFPVKINRTDLTALQDTQKFLYNIGIIKDDFVISDYINNSYYEKSDAEKYLK